MKTYTTYQGARRAARGRPIIRILSDPEQIFIVVPSLLHTKIMSVSDSGCDGSINLTELTLRGKPQPSLEFSVPFDEIDPALLERLRHR